MARKPNQSGQTVIQRFEYGQKAQVERFIGNFFLTIGAFSESLAEKSFRHDNCCSSFPGV